MLDCRNNTDENGMTMTTFPLTSSGYRTRAPKIMSLKDVILIDVQWVFFLTVVPVLMLALFLPAVGMAVAGIMLPVLYFTRSSITFMTPFQNFVFMFNAVFCVAVGALGVVSVTQ